MAAAGCFHVRTQALASFPGGSGYLSQPSPPPQAHLQLPLRQVAAVGQRQHQRVAAARGHRNHAPPLRPARQLELHGGDAVLVHTRAQPAMRGRMWGRG